MDNHSAQQARAAIAAMDHYFRSANKSLQLMAQVLDELTKLAHELPQVESSEDEDRYFRMRHLVLQLRLDTQDMLRMMLSHNQSYCNAIGVSPHNTIEQNLERLAYQFGEDNLLHELELLSDLINELEHTVEQRAKIKRDKLLKARIKRDLTEGKQAKASKSATRAAFNEKLDSVLKLQSQFQYSVEQLTEALQVYPGLPKFGLIYDYLAGLKGPISRFQQLASGLAIQTNQLMNRFNHLLGLQLKPEKQMLQQYLQRLTKQLHQINRQQPKLSNIQQTMLSKRPQQLNDAIKKDPEVSQLQRGLRFFPR